MYYTWLAFTHILEARSQRSRVWIRVDGQGCLAPSTLPMPVCIVCLNLLLGPGSDSRAELLQGLPGQGWPLRCGDCSISRERWLWGEG